MRKHRGSDGRGATAHQNSSQAGRSGVVGGSAIRRLASHAARLHKEKNGRLYRYYLPTRENKEYAGASGLPRLPANELERVVLEQVRRVLRAPTMVAGVIEQATRLDPTLDGAQALKRSPAFGRVASLARRQAEHHGCSRIRGNQMNLGVASAPGLADDLRSAFFSAPVPSGCTLMLVLTSDTASILMRTT